MRRGILFFRLSDSDVTKTAGAMSFLSKALKRSAVPAGISATTGGLVGVANTMRHNNQNPEYAKKSYVRGALLGAASGGTLATGGSVFGRLRAGSKIRNAAKKNPIKYQAPTP